MIEYVLYKGNQEIESGTLLDCWKAMTQHFGWLSMKDIDLLNIRIEAR